MTSAVLRDASGRTRQTLTYAYDVFGNLIERMANGRVERYAYDGENAWADLDGRNRLTTRRIYGDVPDQVLARVSAAGVAAWYLTDHLGSIRVIVDSRGNVIDKIDYDAFGNIIRETNPANGDRYKYAGYRLDPITGFYEDNARWYAALTARFTSQDPLGLTPDVNPYRYVGNHPTYATDPDGMEPPRGQRTIEQIDREIREGIRRAERRGSLSQREYSALVASFMFRQLLPLIHERATVSGTNTPAWILEDVALLNQNSLPEETRVPFAPLPSSANPYERLERARARQAERETQELISRTPTMRAMTPEEALASHRAAAFRQAVADAPWHERAAIRMLPPARAVTDIYTGTLGDTVRDPFEFATGMDLITQKQLSEGERIVTGGAALLPFLSGSQARRLYRWMFGHADEAADAARLGNRLPGEPLPEMTPTGLPGHAPLGNPHLAGRTPLAGTRGTGVRRAIAAEVDLVRRTGQGTIEGGWTAAEVAYMRRTSQLPENIVGHHINNVAQFPEWAGDPRNIRFVRGQAGNLAEHGGNFQNPTTGPLIDR